MASHASHKQPAITPGAAAQNCSSSAGRAGGVHRGELCSPVRSTARQANRAAHGDAVTSINIGIIIICLTVIVPLTSNLICAIPPTPSSLGWLGKIAPQVLGMHLFRVLIVTWKGGAAVALERKVNVICTLT